MDAQTNPSPHSIVLRHVLYLLIFQPLEYSNLYTMRLHILEIVLENLKNDKLLVNIFVYYNIIFGQKFIKLKGFIYKTCFYNIYYIDYLIKL